MYDQEIEQNPPSNHRKSSTNVDGNKTLSQHGECHALQTKCYYEINASGMSEENATNYLVCPSAVSVQSQTTYHKAGIDVH